MESLRNTSPQETGVKLGPIGGVVLLAVVTAGAYFTGLLGWVWRLVY